ncbi:MAG: response regulator [Acidobacteriota bacterium]|nr:response regulator [Acidobacteriota bacterium]
MNSTTYREWTPVTTKSRHFQSVDTSSRSAAQTRVLLVEDTEDNRVMMRRLLEMSGYCVTEAVNGMEAVSQAEQENPQIILMDLSLPLVDGLAATRRIRQLPSVKGVPIIAVSAHDTMDFHAEALAAGCDAYITKPIDYGELEGLIESLLEQHA